jgi:hypothetical protein
MITFVTPFITVVLPDRGTAGLTGTVVLPEMTRSDVPEIRVGEAVMGDAPIKDAITEAMTAWEDEPGEIALDDAGLFEEGDKGAAGALGDAEFGDEGGEDAAGALGDAELFGFEGGEDTAGALGEVDGEGACTVGLFGEDDGGFATVGDGASVFGSCVGVWTGVSTDGDGED